MATRASGDSFDLSALLFSPRAAFVWDSAAETVTWLNAEARRKFKADASGLSAALSSHARARFSALSGSRELVEARYKVNAKNKISLRCSIFPTVLAGGSKGLIVTELGEEAATAPRKSKPKKANGKAPLSKKKKKASRLSKNAPAEKLSPEELKSLQAVGRKVRKLCLEKLKAASPPHETQAGVPRRTRKASPSETAIGNSNENAALAILASAFDLFLLLDQHMKILDTVGDLRRIGWNKSDLIGKPIGTMSSALYLFRPSKSSSKPASFRGHIEVQTAMGGREFCRVACGPWPCKPAYFFAGFISLRSLADNIPKKATANVHSKRLAA